MSFQALQGLRVLEASTGVSGPFCGKLLAEYGADVIKVEPPETGDPTRLEGPLHDQTPHMGRGSLFLHLNTTKKGVTLDLNSAQGRDLFRRLTEQTHVVIESGRPGLMESRGLGYHALKQMSPGLVMTSITPFGQTGPHKDYEFTELTIFAAGGAMYRQGVPDREPLRYAGEMAQYSAGACAAAATMAASLSLWLGAGGQWIDISIQECMAGHPHQIGRRALFAYSGELDGRFLPHSPLSAQSEPYGSGTFRCRDGYVSFLLVGPRMWPGFARMIGRPGLVEDPRFRTSRDREQHHPELLALFQEWLDQHTRKEVFKAAQEARLPGAPVLAIDEVLRDEHLLDREYFVETDDPELGSLPYTGPPFRLSDTPAEGFRPAPRLGEHNEEILGQILGIGGDEIAELHSLGIV